MLKTYDAVNLSRTNHFHRKNDLSATSVSPRMRCTRRMRLVNCRSLQVELFSTDDSCEYAILSHRWEDDEVSLQDLATNDVGSRQGFDKLKQACAEALRTNLSYLWIDTCCIDKTSSAELSEAINSMYKWYEQANVCFVYLSDIEGADDLESSAWFTRGWTLQELIAPKQVRFYNKDWEFFGSKSGMQGRISKITKIPARILRGESPTTCSIAQRMSWAARRVTKRPEDKAYCLMGLFDVNMPMLYGEGMKAFLRLQEEIIKVSDDHSIFSWTSGQVGRRSILAPSPKYFGGLENMISTAASVDPEPYSMTNVGLSIRLPMMPWAMNTYLALIQCNDDSRTKELMPHAQKQAKHMRIGIFLRRTARKQQYVRIGTADGNGYRLDTLEYKEYLTPMSILILHRVTIQEKDDDHLYGFIFRNITSALFRSSRRPSDDRRSPINPYHVVSRRPAKRTVWSSGRWHDLRVWSGHLNEFVMRSDEQPVTEVELPNAEQGLVASFQASTRTASRAPQEGMLESDNVAVMNFGFDFEFNPVCLLYHYKSHKVDELLSLQEKLQSDWSSAASLTSCEALDRELRKYENMSVAESWAGPGVCALRGSKETGLTARLEPLNLHVDIQEGWKDNSTRAWIVDIGAISLPSRAG